MIINTEDIAKLSDDDRIAKINEVKKALHEISPLKAEPVDCVLWVKNDNVHANNYNPNKVASKEMELLHISIKEDGYTQPIVSMKDTEGYVVIDGFHRSRVGKEYDDIKNRCHDYVPITLIREECTNEASRIESTIRHNRARGKHQVDLMGDIVKSLIAQGLDDASIAKEVGMSTEELLRLKQISGVAYTLAGTEYSKAWGDEDVENVK